MPRKRATVLDLSEEFQKKPTYVCSSASGLQSQRKKAQLIPIPAVPRPKNQKKCRFSRIRHRFQPNGCGTAVFQDELRFCWLIPQSRCRTENVRGDFENFTYGLRYRDVSAGLLGQNQINRSNFRGQIWKLGGKILPPKKNLAPLLDSEFDVDYDFAIKHDPIQSDD